MIRTGTIESVDVVTRTARVRFSDKQEMLSGPLKVLKTPPMIVIEKEVDGVKWNMTAEYSTVKRNEIEGVNFAKGDHDEITLSSSIDYKKSNTLTEDTQSCTYTGVIDTKNHKHIVKVYSWMPFIGQSVLCLFKPLENGRSEGYVVGGI